MAAESSRSFRANALVRREIRRRIATARVLSTNVARAHPASSAMTSETPRADHGESLQAAPLLACVASTWRVSLHRARGWHARTRCEHGDVRSVLARHGKKLRERLLTLEKSVIRFRPADISCRSKRASRTQELTAPQPTPPAAAESGCRCPVPHADAGSPVPEVSTSKPAAYRAAGFLVARKSRFSMRRLPSALKQHPVRCAWRAGGRSQVRYLRCLS